MTQPPSDAEIAAADTYERLFVPAEFQEWAPRVATASALRSGQRVLDVACGTGVLAREAAARVGPSGYVAGLDATPGMLVVAKRLTPGIDWRHGLADALPFPDASFDAVVSQFGLMFFPDRERALREMMRVLRPGGRLAIAVWDSLDRTPAYADLVALIDRIAGERAGDALRAPFVLGDTSTLSKLFADADIRGATIATHQSTGRFASIPAMVEAELRGWFPVFGTPLSEAAITEILREAEHVLRPYVTADRTVAFDSPAHIVSAAKGEESPN
jgi:SAM-dependent methyltransferase